MRLLVTTLLLALTSCATTPRWTVEGVQNLTVHVYVASAQEHFERPQFRANYKIRGYATLTGEIWVLGTKDSEGRIRPDLYVLGHELVHHVHWEKPDQFADPDK